jgi:ABC-type transporter Mla MlaB component
MTLRIVAIGPSPSATVKLDGRLTGDEVPELRRVCEGAQRQLTLDLAALQSADRQGVSLLRELRTKGADLSGTSPYLQLLLDGPPHEARA